MGSIRFFTNDNATIENKVSFTISSGHEIEELITCDKENTAFVYWYIGKNGFKKGAVNYYQPILSKNISNGILPFIVDLTAWKALDKEKKGKKKKQKIYKISDYHESAISLDAEKIKTLLSGEYFTLLKKVTEQDQVFPLLKDIANRSSLRELSNGYDDAGKTIKDLFEGNCPALEDIYHLDTAKTYSILQYIEMLFYIEMILTKKKDIERISFILPNDEFKYYPGNMSDDISKFLNNSGYRGINLEVQIKCFRYGKEVRLRPYNYPSETVKCTEKLTISAILDDDILEAKTLINKVRGGSQ